MPAVARIGDKCTHDAVIVTGSATRFADGIGVARLGDKVACPKHGMTTIQQLTATSVRADGLEVAVVGSICGCGAKILYGSPTTFAE
jgi:uncharacterized Zn-binding protein involved in type VI secretion